MTYDLVDWVNGPDGGTPLNSPNLRKANTAINDLDSRVAVLVSALAGKLDTAAAAVTNQRVPTDGSVTDAKVAVGAAISALKIAGLANVAKTGSASDITTGTLPTSVLPALAINDTFVVANQAAMLALTAQRGDIAIRQDRITAQLPATYILSADDATTLANWINLPTPADAVSSVNGQSGIIVLAKGDVGLANVDNTSDTNKPVSTAQATAIGAKQASDSDLTAIAALDSATAGMLSTDGAGWIRKTYAQVKTALAVGAADLSTTGTRNGTKFLRDDNTWVVPSGGSAGNELGWDGTTYQPTSLLGVTTAPRTFKGPVHPSTVSGYVANTTNPYWDTWINTDSSAIGSYLGTGEETVQRSLVGSNAIGCTTGVMRLTAFQARKTETITQIIVPCGATAGATNTLVRVGIFSVAADGALALLAATANTTAMFANSAAFPASPTALTSNFNKVQGLLYAMGVLQVGGTIASLCGQSTNAVITARMRNSYPMITGSVSGLTDLPSSVLGTSVASISSLFYGEMLPA